MEIFRIKIKINTHFSLAILIVGKCKGFRSHLTTTKTKINEVTVIYRGGALALQGSFVAKIASSSTPNECLASQAPPNKLCG